MMQDMDAAEGWLHTQTIVGETKLEACEECKREKRREEKISPHNTPSLPPFGGVKPQSSARGARSLARWSGGGQRLGGIVSGRSCPGLADRVIEGTLMAHREGGGAGSLLEFPPTARMEKEEEVES